MRCVGLGRCASARRRAGGTIALSGVGGSSGRPAPAGASFAAFGAVWFTYFATVGLFNPYAPLWLHDLGWSTLAIGAVASLQAWTRVVAPYAWGWLGDHGGRRVQMIRLAAFGALLSALALPGAQSFTAVAAVTVLLFIANGGVVPLSEALLAQHLTRGSGRAAVMDSARYGRVRVWGSLGFIVAVVLAGAMLDAVGIRLFPWLLAALFGCLWLATLRLPSSALESHPHAAAPPVLTVLRQPEVAWFFGAIFFTVLAHTSLYVFFSLYLVELGYGKVAVGLLWAVAVAVEVVFFWFQGRFFDRVPPYRWLQWAAALTVLRFVATAGWGMVPLVLVAAQLLHAVTFAAQHAACIVLVNRHFPGALRGRGQALYTTLGYGISGVIGGVAGGWLSSRAGLPAVFWAAAVAAAAGWACARCAARHAARDAARRAAPPADLPADGGQISR